MLAYLIQSPWVFSCAAVGLLASTIVATLCKLEPGLYHNGLFGYNGILVGAALGTFEVGQTLGEGLDIYLLIILVASLSSFLFLSLSNIFIPLFGIPPLTLPFNLVTLVVLSAAVQSSRFEFVFEPSLSSTYSGGDTLTHDAWPYFESVLKGFGQVFLCDQILPSILIIAGMLLCSPLGTLYSLCGSGVGVYLYCLDGVD